MREDIVDLLLRVEGESKRDRRLGYRATTRNIFRGCYDVWENEQERLAFAALNIPKQRMDEAKSLGLVDSKLVGKEEEWELTEAGRNYLSIHGGMVTRQSDKLEAAGSIPAGCTETRTATKKYNF